MRVLRRAARFLRGCAAVLVILLGVLAGLHLASLHGGKPWVRVVQVQGGSMLPTLRDGQRVIFVRLAWHVGSIVLANVGEDEPVIKRVVGMHEGLLVLVGDNRAVSAHYVVKPSALEGVLLWSRLFAGQGKSQSASPPTPWPPAPEIAGPALHPLPTPLPPGGIAAPLAKSTPRSAVVSAEHATEVDLRGRTRVAGRIAGPDGALPLPASVRRP